MCGSGSGSGSGSLSDRFEALVQDLASSDVAEIVSLCTIWRARLDGVEAHSVGATLRGARGERARRRLLRDLMTHGRHCSERDARQRRLRARIAATNPELSARAATGEITGEHLDALAGAFRHDAAGVIDPVLAELAASTTPDQARIHATRWVEEHTTADDVADRVRQQHERRALTKSTNPVSGLVTLTLTGDEVTLGDLWRRVCATESDLWRRDGGRDVPSERMTRTTQQRRFDALLALVNGEGARGGRPAVVVEIPIDKLLGQPERAAIAIGQGPLPDDVVADLVELGNLHFLFTGVDREPLWMGRTRRNATTAQLIAMAVRDRGCVLCGSDWRDCAAHHVTPFNSPAKGRTDIDRLRLLCGSDHRHLHDNNLTLERVGGRTWTRRPATASETVTHGSGRPMNRASKLNVSGAEPDSPP